MLSESASSAITYPPGYLGVDPDAPVYRIFPQWSFEEALRLRQMVLVQPRVWEDPFEILLPMVMIEVQDMVPHRQVSLEQHLLPLYAQCWSATQESDTLLRAYSRVEKDPLYRKNTCPSYEGVKVRSTPRKLVEALLAWTTWDKGNSSFVGAVQYHTREEILQSLANEIGLLGLNAFTEPRIMAQASLRKRHEFSHESEVRLMYVETRKNTNEPLIRLPIDPNVLFEEISFDPRLETFERNEREAVARSLGYKGPVVESILYKKTGTVISLANLPQR